MKILKDLNVRSLGENIDINKYLGLQLSDRRFSQHVQGPGLNSQPLDKKKKKKKYQTYIFVLIGRNFLAKASKPQTREKKKKTNQSH